jgi:hypothetical protein
VELSQAVLVGRAVQEDLEALEEQLVQEVLGVQVVLADQEVLVDLVDEVQEDLAALVDLVAEAAVVVREHSPTVRV